MGTRSRINRESRVTHQRFSPGDLAGIVALTEIILRSSPAAGLYRDTLDELGAEAERWVCIDRASVALDLVDLVARNACPDAEARLRLTLALLRPLNDHAARLEVDQLALARELDHELDLGPMPLNVI